MIHSRRNALPSFWAPDCSSFGIGCLCALKVAGASLGLWEICIIWGLGISLAVYLTAGISGAHLNPAVTIALWLFASFPARKVLPFCVAQLAGAFGGAVLAYSLYSSLFIDFESAHNMVRGSAESLQLASIFSTYPAAAINVWQAALVEVVITSMLMGLIMALTDDGNGVPKGPLAPLLIGILVAVIGASTGPLTGFAMNPARDFGPKIFTACGVGKNCDDWWTQYSLFHCTHYCTDHWGMCWCGDLSLSHCKEFTCQ